MLRSIEKANTITENYRVAKDKHLINAGCHEHLLLYLLQATWIL